MPKPKEQIRREPIPQTGWVSPHHGDGGWHTTPGVEEDFDPRNLIPLANRILVERLPMGKIQYSSIIRPDTALASDYETGGPALVLRVGKGRRIENEEGVFEREVLDLKPGDKVWIGPHTDWESGDGKFVICMEADARGIIS